MNKAIVVGLIILVILLAASCSNNQSPKPDISKEQVGGGCGVAAPNVEYDCYADAWQGNAEVIFKERFIAPEGM